MHNSHGREIAVGPPNPRHRRRRNEKDVNRREDEIDLVAVFKQTIGEDQSVIENYGQIRQQYDQAILFPRRRQRQIFLQSQERDEREQHRRHLPAEQQRAANEEGHDPP
ncbi:hypothetical protein ATE48_15615 [Candidatus Viadribacter manganicus]|uniref:Uncharacterized protein n=1 Tax=Candidatus Viadribacter manganicus TaxID=1759059 RepID=A0A1B1AKZ9_9PROT|nr:hypothetical protein ATE48_15615 [Candidatus Viadribacter manganicus]